jgi:hypothetical protein
MEWARAHPYTASIIGALLALALGAFIVFRSAGVAPGGSAAGFGTGGIIYDPTSYGPQTIDLFDAGRGAGTALDGPLSIMLDTSINLPLTEATAGTFDFEAFLASLSGTEGTTAPAAITPTVTYTDFIPKGLISIKEPVEERTELQERLYRYGNAAGQHILEFERRNSAIPQVLKAQVEDRTNAAKAAAVEDLASDLVALGTRLNEMEAVPPEARAANSELASAYRDAGASLALITKAARDEDFVKALIAYNTVAEVAVRKYVTLASLFSIHEVAFTAGDSGSVFTFSNSSL